jgi:23S rRNA (uracil1939-C5)-methyltransferase
MAQGGDAVGRWEGRAVFASGGLPGETVQVRLGDRQKAFARGHVISVHNAAAERVPSFCPLEQTCGAADWRWIEPNAQRRYKTDILREQLRHIGGLDVMVAEPEPLADPDHMLAYRVTAELHVAGEQIGYYRPGTRRTADVGACCLHHPLINGALAALRPILTPEMGLRGVTVRCSPETNTVLAILDSTPRTPKGSLQALVGRWQAAYEPLVGVVKARESGALHGKSFLEQRVNNVRFHVGSSSFFQVNYRQTARMVERVRSLLDPQPDTHLLDLYCGVGLFALSLAPFVAEVVGIEEWAPAIEDARRSARLNGVANAAFETGTVEHILQSQARSFDSVVLDPPRRGCAPEVLETLARLSPRRIVYVSCHPGTLARDCKQLVAAGFRITSAEVIDMFPHTHHIESIVRLQRDT